MGGLSHSWPHLMWTPETRSRGLLCCSHHWCSSTWFVSGPVFVRQRWLLLPLSQGWWAVDDYNLICSVLQCHSVWTGSTCLLLPVFPHLLVKKVLSGFPQLPRHRHTWYFTASLGFELAPFPKSCRVMFSPEQGLAFSVGFHMLFVLAILCCSC